MRAIVNISLPFQLNAFVEKEVITKHYSTKSEFFRYLLRLWIEGKLAEEIGDSKKELEAGKGTLLKSLSDLRWKLSQMKIYYSSKFAKEYKKLSLKVKLTAERKEKIFRKDSFNPTLKTHRLSGKLKEYYSFSINYKYRIIFEFSNNTVWFHSVGTHEIYGWQVSLLPLPLNHQR